MGEKLKIEYVPISGIKPYRNNAKLHPPEQVEQIRRSIEEFGFNDPLALWHGEIVEGHGRYLAALELGLDTLPVIKLDELTDEQRRAYALAHNKLTMNSDFDLDLLDLELADINMDMSQFGFEGVMDDESAETDDGVEQNPTLALPESRLYIFSMSSFGTASEVFIEAKLTQEEADHLIEKNKEVSTAEICEKLRGAISAL